MSEGTLGLTQFSDSLAAAVARATPALVRVDDGTRLTASGVIWREDGVIVTTSHGVERDEELSVFLADGSHHPVTLVGRDDDTDIAVLRIEGATGLPVVPRIETETEVRVGSLAVAVGTPGEAGVLATLGLVARKQETETAGHPEYILYTDAVLYPGVSGGPLVDTEGRMLGLLNRLYGRGLGVALGTPLVARVVETLLTHGRVPRGYLGVRTQLVGLPESLQAGLALTQDRGLLVAMVEPGSPADTGGLLLGDTLLAINGEAISDVTDLRRHLYAGKPVTIKIVRGGTLTELSVTVGADKG
jgi:S1-C subfamily serine protease